MELELTSDQELFLETTRKFVDSECPITRVRELIDDPVGFDRDTWRRGARGRRAGGGGERRPARAGPGAGPGARPAGEGVAGLRPGPGRRPGGGRGGGGPGWWLRRRPCRVGGGGRGGCARRGGAPSG